MLQFTQNLVSKNFQLQFTAKKKDCTYWNILCTRLHTFGTIYSKSEIVFYVAQEVVLIQNVTADLIKMLWFWVFFLLLLVRYQLKLEKIWWFYFFFVNRNIQGDTWKDFHFFIGKLVKRKYMTGFGKGMNFNFKLSLKIKGGREKERTRNTSNPSNQDNGIYSSVHR